jgi:hypothetical protein
VTYRRVGVNHLGRHRALGNSLNEGIVEAATRPGVPLIVLDIEAPDVRKLYAPARAGAPRRGAVTRSRPLRWNLIDLGAALVLPMPAKSSCLWCRRRRPERRMMMGDKPFTSLLHEEYRDRAGSVLSVPPTLRM